MIDRAKTLQGILRSLQTTKVNHPRFESLAVPPNFPVKPLNNAQIDTMDQHVKLEDVPV